FKETISIKGSSGSALFDAFATDILKSDYIATYTAIVESVLGTSVKVIVQAYSVKMRTTNGRVSYAQRQNLNQAKSIASKAVGQTRVIEKTKVTQIK
ncbi:MAG: hypothetical protein GY757_60195, partial [bacterium]|nr:hypothetical protein [bacterium]